MKAMKKWLEIYECTEEGTKTLGIFNYEEKQSAKLRLTELRRHNPSKDFAIDLWIGDAVNGTYAMLNW